MKHNLRTHSSSLFLLELVVAILIFSFAGALSLQFFAKAHLWNRESKVLNYFSNECSIAAEITSVVSSKDELEERLFLLYPDLQQNQEQLNLYFNEELKLCRKKEADYHYSINYFEKDGLLTCIGRVFNLETGEIIYELTAKHDLGGSVHE